MGEEKPPVTARAEVRRWGPGTAPGDHEHPVRLEPRSHLHRPRGSKFRAQPPSPSHQDGACRRSISAFCSTFRPARALPLPNAPQESCGAGPWSVLHPGPRRRLPHLAPPRPRARVLVTARGAGRRGELRSLDSGPLSISSSRSPRGVGVISSASCERDWARLSTQRRGRPGACGHSGVALHPRDPSACACKAPGTWPGRQAPASAPRRGHPRTPEPHTGHRPFPDA